MHVLSTTFSNVKQSSTLVYNKFENFYIERVKDVFHFLHSHQLTFLANVVATFMIEPFNAIHAGYLMQKGLDGKKIRNLNPKKLSQEQLKYSPVLLIHGDSSNSGLFAPLLERLSAEMPHKPFFTIDLVNQDGIVSAKNHLKILFAKVKEITDLYPSDTPPKLSFVGHSSGGDILGPLVKLMQTKQLTKPGAMIKIGSIFSKFEAEEFSHFSHGKFLEILGTKDIFEGDKSHLPNKLVVNSGHLGLLFKDTVIKHLSNELKLAL